MLIATAALIIPTALYSTFPGSTDGVEISKKILSFSRATAGVLLIVYAVYLYFQLKTHSFVFAELEDDDVNDDYGVHGHDPEPPAGGDADEHDRQDAHGGTEEEDDSSDTPSMRDVYVAAAVLVAAGLAIGKCTHYFIESLDGMTQTLGITKTFVAMIILPIPSNAPELSQMVAAARKKKINFAIGVIIGSVVQITLFVLPILVVAGWLMNRDMDLYFEPSKTFILLLTVMTVNQVLQEKKYTYLHGVMLLSV